MKFPYPENPNDWQTAYTRENAYQDSDKYGSKFILPIFFCFLILLTYVCLRTIPFPFFKTYSLLIRVGFAVAFLLLFFLLFVLMAFVPANYFASKFLTEFYNLPSTVDPSKIINHRLFGISKLPPPLNKFSESPYIIAKNGEIDKKDKWTGWISGHLGGPINLIVFDGNALYLERGNRFSRIVGPGEKISFLEWYETIKYVVDLRPKVKSDKFDVWTKDGINIKLTAQIECRIGDPSKNDPVNGIVYPYDPVAVKKAIERHALRWLPNRQEGEPSEFTWIDAAWGQVTGIVPGYIGSRMLDDLFIASRESGQILSPSAMKEVFEKLNNATKIFGVFIMDFQIVKVEMPEQVYEHQKDQWKTERQSITTIVEGQTKAFHIRSQEKARADAQRDLILAIVDGLEKNNDGKYAEPLLLSLSGILDNSMKDPLMRAYLANETLETLGKIKTMLDESPS
jgi:regulator of protease activity HflC (stomatin/prohibitin superfamily)